MLLSQLLVKKSRIVSMSQGRRVISQGAVRVNGQVADDLQTEVKIADVISIGKRDEFVVTNDDVQ
jgi:ribosomal protein S4